MGLLRGSISFVYSKGPEYTMANPPSPSYAFVAGSDPVTAMDTGPAAPVGPDAGPSSAAAAAPSCTPTATPQSAQFLH